MNPLCIYHRADLDGVCSAAIVKHFVPDVELFGIDYGEQFPWPLVAPLYMAKCTDAEGNYSEEELKKGRHLWPQGGTGPRVVYMVDFSLPVEDMKKLAACSRLVWIDHHKSAIEAARKEPFNCCNFLDSRFAACELAWAWFAEHEMGEAAYEKITVHGATLPEAVRLLGRYDVWDEKNPHWEARILPFQYGCRALSGIYDPSCWAWPRLFGAGASAGNPLPGVELDTQLLSDGRVILAYRRQELEEQAKRGAYESKIVVDGGVEFRAVCLNTASIGSSSFDAVYDPGKHDLMIAYFRRPDGKWRHGIYTTKPEIDCSKIAAAFGGGGHAKAAGCITDNPLV